MNLADVVEAMAGAGCTAEQIAAVSTSLRRRKPAMTGAERQALYRARHQRNESDEKSVTPRHARNESDESDVTPLPPLKKDPPDPLKELTPLTPASLRSAPPTPPATVTPAVTPRSVLLECLTDDDADAVLAHRRAKRCPLTVRAAQLLVKGFQATGDPHAAVDMMIERGWQGFKPEWFDNERSGNGRRKPTLGEAALALSRRFAAEERQVRSENGGVSGGPALQLVPFRRGE